MGCRTLARQPIWTNRFYYKIFFYRKRHMKYDKIVKAILHRTSQSFYCAGKDWWLGSGRIGSCKEYGTLSWITAARGGSDFGRLHRKESKSKDTLWYDCIKPEYAFGNSRMDFYMEKGKQKYLMEVKGCTLEIDGVGYFPDAPTERGKGRRCWGAFPEMSCWDG